MLYTKGFLLAGVVAAALTLAALAEVPANAAGAEVRHVDVADRTALGHLGRAVGSHVFVRDRLHEPDFDMAVQARDAAEFTQGHTRATMLALADAASRSALEFLVDYNIAAGGWEAATGIRMPAAAPLAA